MEHKSYHLLCKADANPPPSEYIWVGPQITDLTYNATIDLPDVKRTQNGIYSCHARNMMHPTYGENRTKEMASTVNVEILCKLCTCSISYHNKLLLDVIIYVTCPPFEVRVEIVEPKVIYYNG